MLGTRLPLKFVISLSRHGRKSEPPLIEGENICFKRLGIERISSYSLLNFLFVCCVDLTRNMPVRVSLSHLDVVSGASPLLWSPDKGLQMEVVRLCQRTCEGEEVEYDQQEQTANKSKRNQGIKQKENRIDQQFPHCAQDLLNPNKPSNYNI